MTVPSGKILKIIDVKKSSASPYLLCRNDLRTGGRQTNVANVAMQRNATVATAQRHKIVIKMPVRRRKNATTANAAASADGADHSATGSSASDDKYSKATKKPKQQTAAEFRGMHLAPLPLVMIVLLCSGALWVLSFRDVMATGRSIAGGMDDAMLVSFVCTYTYLYAPSVRCGW